MTGKNLVASRPAVPCVQSILEEELVRLGRLLDYPINLKVRWQPTDNSPLDGEVKGQIIWIYCKSKEQAVAVLRHEILDWVVVDAIRPYQEMVNMHRVLLNASLKQMQDTAYARKEEVVEALCKMIGEADEGVINYNGT